MPVDLSVGNSIIQAFQQGFQEQQAKQNAATQKKQKQDELDQQAKLATDRLNEEQRQFNMSHAAVKALNDLQIAKAQNDIKTGVYNSPTPTPLEGSTLVSTQNDENGKPQYSTYSHPSIGTYTVPTLPYRATQQAQQSEIENRPAVEAKLEESKQALDAKHEEDILRFNSDLQRQRENNQLRLEIAKMTGANKEDVTRLSNEGKEAVAQLRNEFYLGKVSDTDKDKLNLLDELTDKATEFRDILAKGGIRYYTGTGISGTVNDLLKDVAGHENAAIPDKNGRPITDADGNVLTYKDVRTKASELQSLLSQERFKSRFTATEQKQVNSYIPTDARTEAPDSVMSKLNTLIPSLSQQKNDILKPRPLRTLPDPSVSPNSTRPPLSSFEKKPN